MILGAAGLLVLVSPAAPGAQDDHTGTFEEVVAHRSLDDLKNWRARHPWSLGDRLAEFLDTLLAARRALDRTAVEQRGITASFLAEMLAEDPFSGWIVGVTEWDMEACARQETAELAVKDLPSMIASGEGDAAWSQIEEMRGSSVPKGGWPLLEADLARCAAAYLHAGDRARAKKLATELASSAEELRRGVVLAASERILGEIARLEGDIDDAIRRTARAFELGSGLDSGAESVLPRSIEALETCDLDTLVELTAGPEGAMLVVVGEKTRLARKVPLEDVEKRVSELPLGSQVGIVADGKLASLLFESIAGGARSVVRLSRPPLGALDTRRPVPSKRSWIAILDEKAASPAIGGDEVKTLRGASADEIANAAKGCSHLYVDADLSAEALRGRHLDAAVAVLARPGPPALVDALHASGVRDVLVRSQAGGEDARNFLDDVCARLGRGETLVDAVRAARSSASPGWIVRRRS